MKKVKFHEALALILQQDERYPGDAYLFVREGLDYTIKQLDKPIEGPGRHVSGQELLAGLRDYALQEYGPLARRVLAYWGVCSCEDFGEIVFNLVHAGVLGKTENDQKADFTSGYDFDAAFSAPFIPEQIRKPPVPRASRPGMQAGQSS